MLGLSGGSDSVFALFFMHKFKKLFNAELSAVHINHNLRGRDSLLDEKFCRELCRRLDVPFFNDSVFPQELVKQNKVSLEEACRELRYNIFGKILEENNLDKIITAHIQDDNTETVFLNIIKGTGVAGLSGIPISRNNIIRPLLCLTKEEVLLYLKANRIKYRKDKSNFSDEFQRNLIRNKIIPVVKKSLNPSVHEAVFRTTQNIAGFQKVFFNELETKLDLYFKVSKRGLVINKILFKSGEAYTREMLRAYFRKAGGYSFAFEDAEKLIELSSKQTGYSIQLKKNLIALNERKTIHILPRPRKTPETKYFKLGESVIIDRMRIGALRIKNLSLKKSSSEVEYISGDNIDDLFELRNWKAGDKFQPLGMTNSKKISDFLTDRKIPAGEKRDFKILLNRNNIVWAVGLRIDERVKITNETKSVVKLWRKKI